MNHTYHLTPVSGNQKTGPIPVSTTSATTCPAACPLKANGCYAETGPLGLHWNAINTGKRGTNLDAFCQQIKALPKQQLWRWAQAGDLPGANNRIDHRAVAKLVEANRGRHGFGFTHYPMTPANARTVRHANDEGFTLNLSANNLEHADRLADTGAGPVVTLLPEGTTKPVKTPGGRLVTVCPAYTTDMQCSRCGICAVPHRKAIIGFPVHGTSKAKAGKVFMMRQV